MVAGISAPLLKEERIVAEISRLGITYLSRLSTLQVKKPRGVPVLLADLVCQPSSRVRTATIPLLLEHPEYAAHLPSAVERLHGNPRLILKIFYTAAVILQRIYAVDIHPMQGSRFAWLPDLFTAELGLPENLPGHQRLKALGAIHQAASDSMVNWAGTYENATRHWLRRRELESKWSL